MKETLHKYKCEFVWHFTDRANLDLIQEHGGIYSLAELERRAIEVPVPGGNEWSHSADKQRGLDVYVHLTFLPDHPMLYKLKMEQRLVNPIWLMIESSVLLQEGVRFTTDVANKAGVSVLTPEEAQDTIDFDVLFTRTNWNLPEIQARRQNAIKSEILIPDFVPIKKIRSYKNG